MEKLVWNGEQVCRKKSAQLFAAILCHGAGLDQTERDSRSFFRVNTEGKCHSESPPCRPIHRTLDAASNKGYVSDEAI
eukprot:scaffold553553_cov20-Prasinocladus_malaysianus.AAC.1